MIITLCSITTYVLRCSKLPPILLWVWIVNRYKSSLYCVLQILHKYFRNTEWFILHLCFFINQKRLSDREYLPILYLGFWKIQTRFLYNESSGRSNTKNPIFRILVLAKASVTRSFIFMVFYKILFHSSIFFLLSLISKSALPNLSYHAL